MKIIRYQDNSGQIGYAVEQDGGHFRIRGDIFGKHEITREPAQVDRPLAPIASPPMIWCIGLNYRRHAQETGMAIPEYPVVFAKGPNCLQGPDAPIFIPKAAGTTQLDYECELVVVIGKTCKDVTREAAVGYIAGYSCGNDVSTRDWQFQKSGSQWCRSKSFDTFAPIGPCLVTPESLPDPNALRIQTLVNGEVLQDSNTSDMIFDIPTLVSFLSLSTTLLPGTLIFTGTPQGVGMGRKPPRWLRAGEEVSIVIEGIGRLTNPVRDEPAR